MTIVLARGRGPKARHNGKRASFTSTGRGGWTLVTLTEGGSVKWRTGHWSTEAEPLVASAASAASAATGEALILLLADDQLVDIAKGLGTPAVCNYRCASKRFAALEAGPCFAHVELRHGVPLGLGVHRSRQLDFVRFLGDNGAQLQTLHMTLGESEAHIVYWLLQKCRTDALRECRIDTPRSIFNDGRWSMTFAGMGRRSIPHPHEYQALLDQKLPLAAGTPLSAVTRTGAVAATCPMLTYLDCSIDNLTALQALQNLVTVNAAFSELDDVNWLVEQLPRLRHLGVRGDDLGHHDRWHLELRSASLESIDLSMAGKGLAIGSLDCPKLRKVICGLYAYRNGLVLMTPSSQHIVFDRDSTSEADLDAPCCFVAHPGPGASLGFIEDPKVVALPEGCAVSWLDTHRGRYGTSHSLDDAVAVRGDLLLRDAVALMAGRVPCF